MLSVLWSGNQVKHQIYIPRHIDTNQSSPIMFCDRNTNPSIPILYATLSEREGCTAWTPGEAWCRIAGDSIFSGWKFSAIFVQCFWWLVPDGRLHQFFCLEILAHRSCVLCCPLCLLVSFDGCKGAILIPGVTDLVSFVPFGVFCKK